MGLLRSVSKFDTHHFVPGLINKGDSIIDIGANFGYYTTIFSRNCGESGKVYAVEPVPLYRKILYSNTRKYKNIEIIPFALSDSERSTKMGIPGNKKYRHGLTRIIDQKEINKTEKAIPIETRTPDSLFGSIDRLDYLKCDIEGHESKVIPLFAKLFLKFKPIVQIEIEKSNFDLIDSLLKSIGYNSYYVDKDKLKHYDGSQTYNSDLFYLNKEKYLQVTQNNQKFNS